MIAIARCNGLGAAATVSFALKPRTGTMSGRIAIAVALVAAAGFAPQAALWAQNAAGSDPAARAHARPSFTGVWEPLAWSTDEWPLEPPYSAAGRAAQERWAANPADDPS